MQTPKPKRRLVRISAKQVAEDRAAYFRDVLPEVRERRQLQLAELVKIERDPKPLATIARKAGWKDKTIVDFLGSLTFQAETPEKARFLSALLATVASGNDARKLLGIEPAKVGNRKPLLHLHAAAHEIEALIAEGVGFDEALRSVTEITHDPNLRRYYFRIKKDWPDSVKQAYDFKTVTLGAPRRRGDKS